jgi:hypothetical protein
MNKSFCNNVFGQLWPQSGDVHYFGTLNRKSGDFRNHSIYDTTSVDQIAATLARPGVDVYFAPAAFVDDRNRTAANAVSASALWLDLDVSELKVETKNGYSSLDGALIALVEFSQKTGLPAPNIKICSGSGLHAYWCFPTPVPKSQWVAMAVKFKAITESAGLLADPHRTADIASVMRVPGTLNYKNNPPTSVYLIEPPSPCIPFEEMNACIERLASENCQQPLAVATPDDQVAPATETIGLDQEVLVELQVLLAQIDPDLPRQSWFRVAAAIRNETGGVDVGFELFDAWSRRGRKYTGIESTRQLWRSIKPGYSKPVLKGTLAWLARQQALHGTTRPIVIAAGDARPINGGVA